VIYIAYISVGWAAEFRHWLTQLPSQAFGWEHHCKDEFLALVGESASLQCGFGLGARWTAYLSFQKHKVNAWFLRCYVCLSTTEWVFLNLVPWMVIKSCQAVNFDPRQFPLYIKLKISFSVFLRYAFFVQKKCYITPVICPWFKSATVWRHDSLLIQTAQFVCTCACMHIWFVFPDVWITGIYRGK
jgi:hypothetical protein